jgi:hypothetical protein
MTKAEVIADVSKALSSGREITSANLQSVARILQGLSKGRDVEEFLGDCFAWFLEKREDFTSMADEEIFNCVSNKFRDWLKEHKAEDEQRRVSEVFHAGSLQDNQPKKPIKNLPWQAGQRPVNREGHALPESKTEISYFEVIPEYKKSNRDERAEDTRRHKEHMKILKRLKSKKYYRWLLEYFVRRLEEEVERQHFPELEQEHRRKASDAISRAVSKAIKK